jgi:hypothetical protein
MRRQAADQPSLVSVHDIQHNLQVFRSSLRVSSLSRYKSCMSWPPSSTVYETLNYKKYNILSPSLYSLLSSTRYTYNSDSTFDPLQSNDRNIGCRETASKVLIQIIILLPEETWQCPASNFPLVYKTILQVATSECFCQWPQLCTGSCYQC